METKFIALNTNSDTYVNHSQDSLSPVDPDREPFLNFDSASELSPEDELAVYCSLVALVKADYPFDNVLQNRTVHFLRSLEPKPNTSHPPPRQMTNLVLSSVGSASAFFDGILTLLASPHSTVAAAALSFLRNSVFDSSFAVRLHLVETDLVTKVLAIVQPHTMPISGNETNISHLIRIIDRFVSLAHPKSLMRLGIMNAVDQYNHHEMIFQKVVISSSQFVRFLISNRYILNRNLFDSFMFLLSTILRICSFHRPTLEFVVASPIVMAISSCLSFIENDDDIWSILVKIKLSLKEWRKQGQEVVQSGKQILQALFLEGFEVTLEQKLLNDIDGDYGHNVVDDCLALIQSLGSNMPR